MWCALYHYTIWSCIRRFYPLFINNEPTRSDKHLEEGSLAIVGTVISGKWGIIFAYWCSYIRLHFSFGSIDKNSARNGWDSASCSPRASHWKVCPKYIYIELVRCLEKNFNRPCFLDFNFVSHLEKVHPLLFFSLTPSLGFENCFSRAFNINARFFSYGSSMWPMPSLP